MTNALLMLSEGAAGEAGATGVMDSVMNKTGSFLGLVTEIGNTCANNEICLAFLTVTFIGLGVRLLRKIIGAFGRGR